MPTVTTWDENIGFYYHFTSLCNFKKIYESNRIKLSRCSLAKNAAIEAMALYEAIEGIIKNEELKNNLSRTYNCQDDNQLINEIIKGRESSYVACFTYQKYENNNDALTKDFLWKFYADNYKGVAIRFVHEAFPFMSSAVKYETNDYNSYETCLMPTDSKFERNKLYLEEKNGFIAYTLLDFTGEIANGVTRIPAPEPFDLSKLCDIIKTSILCQAEKAGQISPEYNRCGFRVCKVNYEVEALKKGLQFLSKVNNRFMLDLALDSYKPSCCRLEDEVRLIVPYSNRDDYLRALKEHSREGYEVPSNFLSNDSEEDCLYYPIDCLSNDSIERVFCKDEKTYKEILTILSPDKVELWQ